MARFRPFRGIRFCRDKVGSFDAVVAPPYDVISSGARNALFRSGPYNVTRLILHPEGHDAAAAQFQAWVRERVLVREDTPAFYVYRQDFELEGSFSRVGVIGALHLEPFSTGVVRPHERTFDHHKRDRLELTRAVKANLSPIFGLYSNPDFDPEPDDGWDSRADIDVVHEGVRNRLWAVHRSDNTARISGAVAGRMVFIADGHHRYETALNYYQVTHPGRPLSSAGDAPGDEVEPAAHVMAFLARFEDPGMIILPTHRIATSLGGATAAALERALRERFSVESVPCSAEGKGRALAWLEQAPPDTNVFVVGFRGASSCLLVSRDAVNVGEGGPRAARLDVSVLHSVILGEALREAGGDEAALSYSADAGETFARLENGDAEAVFLMRATRATEMAEVCSAGELLPQKSTYFYPKLLTGLVFHSLESP